MKEIEWLTIHVSATPPSMDIGAEEINQWHLNNGWKGIGYHYVIRRNGSIEKGRADDMRGARTLGHNDNNLGICLIGGVEQKDKTTPQDNFTKSQMNISTRPREGVPRGASDGAQRLSRT